MRCFHNNRSYKKFNGNNAIRFSRYGLVVTHTCILLIYTILLNNANLVTVIFKKMMIFISDMISISL